MSVTEPIIPPTGDAPPLRDIDGDSPVFDADAARARGLRLPERFIIGAAKTSTTSLYRELASHPRVAPSAVKEPCFFSEDHRYSRGLGSYAELYRPDEHRDVLIDASTQYARRTVFPDVAPRIARASPDARFVYILRHPVDRAYSHYRHRWIKEVHPGEPFTQDFDAFVAAEPMCVDDSRYRLQYEAYRQHFDADRILLLLYDDAVADRAGFVRRVCAFFDLDPSALALESQGQRANVADDYAAKLAMNRARESRHRNPLWRWLRNATPRGVRRWWFRKAVRDADRWKQEAAEFSPIPLSEDARRRWLSEFADTVEWVEQMTGRHLPDWHR